MKSGVHPLFQTSLSEEFCLVPRYSLSAEDVGLCFERVGDFIRQLWSGKEKSAESSLFRLIAVIEQQVHVKFRRQSPWVLHMLASFEVEGLRNPEFRLLQAGFRDIWIQLQRHITREEVMLFPFLRKIKANSLRRDLLLGGVYNEVFTSMSQVMLASWAELEQSTAGLAMILESVKKEEVVNESSRCLLTVLERYLQNLQAALDLESEQLFPQIQQPLAFGNLAQISD